MWSVPSRRREPSTAVRMLYRAAVELAGGAAGVGDEAVLGGQHHLVAAAADGPADELLVGVRPVDLGGVQQGHAEIERAVDGADGLGVVGAGAGVGEGHAHAAQADAGDGQVAQLNGAHRRASSQEWWRAVLVEALIGAQWARTGTAGPSASSVGEPVVRRSSVRTRTATIRAASSMIAVAHQNAVT